MAKNKKTPAEFATLATQVNKPVIITICKKIGRRGRLKTEKRRLILLGINSSQPDYMALSTKTEDTEQPVLIFFAEQKTAISKVETDRGVLLYENPNKELFK